RPCQRPRCDRSAWRSCPLLGCVHQALACRSPTVSSRRAGGVLCHLVAVVRPVCSPQSRFLSHLHHRAQLQALPHSRIPAHSTVLVLRRRSPRRLVALDRCLSVVARLRRASALANSTNQRRHSSSALLVRLLHPLLLHLEVKTAGLHPSYHSDHCSSHCSTHPSCCCSEIE